MPAGTLTPKALVHLMERPLLMLVTVSCTPTGVIAEKHTGFDEYPSAVNVARPVSELGLVAGYATAAEPDGAIGGGPPRMTDSGTSSSITGGTVVVVVVVVDEPPPAATENKVSANNVRTESAPIRRRS